MITQTFRVTRVLAGHSPVARIDGVDDDDGLELHLEVPVDAVRGASPGQVIVVNWTLQASATPERRRSRVNPPPRVRRPVVIDAEFTTSRHARAPHTTLAGQRHEAATWAAAVDQEFMSLMAGGAPPGAVPGSHEPRHRPELNTLLGSAGAKGQK
jgi:hypothetical protein